MRRRQIIAAWLSLFAMLMIFAGPLISQGISLAHGNNLPMSMAGMACREMSGMSPISAHGAVEQHHELIVWEKCGYCSLLFQHPPLAESNLFPLRLNHPPLLFFSIHFIPEQATPPVFPGARSRAPPGIPLNVNSHFC